MSERFERLIIGSAHEGAEGMFEPGGEEQALDETQVQQRRMERGIFSDAQERFENTLAEQGLEQVRELPNGMEYPTLDKWVAHRIGYERGTKFFPSFVQNQEGEVFFCKTQISDNPDALKGLEREAIRLNMIPEGVTAPKLVRYVSPQENRAALLITEAISMREATIAPAEMWTTAHASDAARQVKLLEGKDIPQEEGVSKFVENVRQLMDRAGDSLLPDVRAELTRNLVGYEAQIAPAFVHGDLALKNILISTKEDDARVYLVDWEFEGNGFVGQDAAKLWTGLRKNLGAGQAFLDAYVRDGDGTINEQRKKALTFGVAAENLVHLVWRHENIIMAGKEAQYPQAREQIAESNQRMLDVIRDIAALAT